ncbi:UNVERIFIED_CONTAM: movement protein [Sesamum latifolium]|uniref:Movement protein n=1 Tax=Sesamum latifolium TaxID=2727402 RepID=A0AAW2TN90_9LAMI
MSFLKDKLKDWCYQASIQKNMKRLRSTIKRTPLYCDNNDFPTIIGESSEPRKRKKQNNNSYPGSSRRTSFRRRSWWSKSKDEPLLEELSDGPIPEPMKVSKTAIAGPAEKRVTYLQTACRNVGNYANLKPQMTSLMQSIMAIWILFQNDGIKQNHGKNHASRFQPQPVRRFRIGGIDRILNQIGLNQRRHHIIYKVSSGEFAIPMELTGNVMEMQLIPKEEILEEREGIDSEIHLSIMDRRINNLRDGCVGTMIENLYAGKLMFDIHPRIAYNVADQDFSRVLTLHQDFKRKDLMKEENRPYSITYRIAYALSNTHHSDLFLRKEYIEIPRIFKKFAEVMTPDPIKIPRIGGVDLVIKDHPILERTLSTRIEFSSRMSFSEDRITGYRGKETELIRTFTPLEIRDQGFTAKPGVFPREAMKTLPVIAGRDFSQKILILNKGIREAKIMIGGAFGTPWFRDKRKFGKALLSFRQQGLIESDSFYEESKKEIINLKKALQEIKSLDISEESKLSLENVKRLIHRNFS